MVLQQMVTYLTAREFEMPRLVGDSLSLSYVDQPDASEAVFDTPSGKTISVPVTEHRRQYVAMLENAQESGFLPCAGQFAGTRTPCGGQCRYE